MREFTGSSKWGGKPENFFRCKSFSEMPKNRASGPKIRGVQKLEKRVVFWHKKYHKFRIRHPIIFFSNFFQPINAAEKALCTKIHFSNGNHSIKKNAKIPKISKILLSYFLKKKIEKKIGKNKKKIGNFFFFGACGASFFSIGK